MNDLIFKNFDKELEQTINECLDGKEFVVTKWGNARLNNEGYYHITSSKERNKDKFLHRLIWENYHGKPVPKGYVIHHLNCIKTDNRIQNLQCCKISNHISFHAKQKRFNHSEEFKRQRSIQYSGKGNPCYGRKRNREEMSGLISRNIKNSKLSYYDNFCGLVYLMHRKNAGLTQMGIIKEIGFNSSSYISQKLSRLNLSWGDL